MINSALLETFSDHTAIISHDGQPHSYGALLANAHRLAAVLETRSLVFCLCDNTLGSLTGYLSLLLNGSVPLMLDHGLDQELLNNLISIYKPGYIWTPQKRAESIGQGNVAIRLLDYSLIQLPAGNAYPMHRDLGLLLTTSGSTGSPKLVKLTYENIHANASSIAEYLSIDQNERPITALPMSYSFGLSIINSHLIKGATILLTPHSLTEKPFWEIFNTFKATSLSGVPYSYEILKKVRFLNRHYPHLKTMTQAGGKLEAGLTREFAEFCKANGIRFFVMYGQTEATARMSYLHPDYSLTKLGSMGVAIPGGTFSLIDDNGTRIEDSDVIGELVYSGRNVSMGYAVCGEDLAKGDENKGILVTGDLAKRDAEGFYYIVGRKKRFIKLFGNRINLDETEQLIKQITADCACTGHDGKMLIYVTRRDLIQQVKDFVSAKTGINPTGFDIRHINAIPKNSSGKTLYSDLDV